MGDVVDESDLTERESAEAAVLGKVEGMLATELVTALGIPVAESE